MDFIKTLLVDALMLEILLEEHKKSRLIISIVFFRNFFHSIDIFKCLFLTITGLVPLSIWHNVFFGAAACWMSEQSACWIVLCWIILFIGEICPYFIEGLKLFWEDLYILCLIDAEKFFIIVIIDFREDFYHILIFTFHISQLFSNILLVPFHRYYLLNLHGHYILVLLKLCQTRMIDLVKIQNLSTEGLVGHLQFIEL